jgi:hypothetical protein
MKHSRTVMSARNLNTTYVDVTQRQLVSLIYSHSVSLDSFEQLKVYAILLGDFGLFKREDFKSIFSIFLAVFFTFATTLIILNVLIAVASDSVGHIW